MFVEALPCLESTPWTNLMKWCEHIYNGDCPSSISCECALEPSCACSAVFAAFKMVRKGRGLGLGWLDIVPLLEIMRGAINSRHQPEEEHIDWG